MLSTPQREPFWYRKQFHVEHIHHLAIEHWGITSSVWEQRCHSKRCTFTEDEIKEEPKKETNEKTKEEIKEEPKEEINEKPKEEIKEEIKEEPKVEPKVESKEKYGQYHL